MSFLCIRDRRILSLMAGALLAALLASCSTVSHINIEKKTALPAKDSNSLLAGVAEVNITPPPGLPFTGRSKEGNISEGVRTKLKARAFYIKPRQGEPLAIVQLDLLSAESLLHHRIAALIADKTDIQAHNLSLNATHTHAGPGQINSYNVFNEMSSPKSGFDPVLFENLAQKIATALIIAYEGRRPAKIATGQIDVWGQTRNRSLEPHVNNVDVENKSIAIPSRYRAIDPKLTMIRIDAQTEAGDYQPLGAISTFSIHGTGTQSKELALNNADVWAYISQELEWNIAEQYQAPWRAIHGAFEANHADVAPNTTREKMGFIETRKVGMGIGEKAWQLFQSLDNQLKADITVFSSMREINLLKQPEIDGIVLCDRAYYGTAGAAGPDEFETIVHNLFPFKRSSPATFFRGCHGSKHIAGWAWGQSLVFDKEDFPHMLNIHIAKIGDLIMVSLPFEVTVNGGKRIKEKVRAAITGIEGSDEIKHVVVSSVANGYFGYATTAEEYELQWYEGGSTLYGPNTLAFLAAHSAALSAELMRERRSIDDLPSSWSRSLKSADFQLPNLATIAPRAVIEVASYHEAAINEEAYWAFQWKDVPPNLIQLDQPLVAVEYRQGDQDWQPLLIDQRPVDDKGYDIAIIYKDELDGDNRGHYETHWYNPPVQPDVQYRFVIASRAEQPTLYSPSFRW